MKTMNKLFISLIMLAFILAGCGTTENNSDTSNGDDTNKTPTEVEEPAPTDDVNGETGSEGTDDGKGRANEMRLEYSFNQATFDATASLKSSENQHYSMYILPEFELAEEEPYRDQVMLSANGEIFMRVELISTDVDWNILEQTTREQLSAVSSEIEEIQAPAEPFFTNAIALQASGNGDLVTAYLIKNDVTPLKLTLFMNEDNDYTDPFLKMAQTIQKDKD